MSTLGRRSTKGDYHLNPARLPVPPRPLVKNRAFPSLFILSRHAKWGVFPTFPTRSEEHTSELQSLMRISYAVFCLTKNITGTTPSSTQLTSHVQVVTQPTRPSNLITIFTHHSQPTHTH